MTRILFASLLFTFSFQVFSQEDKEVTIPVQKQLDAYNNRDIEAFLAPYSDSVKVYNHPNRLIISGKAQMRANYQGMFKNNLDLHCTLVNRMVLGNIVIDQESVVLNKGVPPVEVMAMFKVKDGKIQEVYFILPDPK